MVNMVTHNTDAARYELYVDGVASGFVDYEVRGREIHLVHTEVDPAKRHGGLASELVRSVLDDLRPGGLRIAADCPYVAGWIARHPDYQELLER